MERRDPTGSDWTPGEIDLIIADYFCMLAMDLRTTPYVKAQHNIALQELTGRSRSSIEFKHQNISAVLVKLGLPWIPGYKPLANYQKALIDGIERYLLSRGEPQFPSISSADRQFAEEQAILLEPPPLLAISRNEDNVELERLVRRFDPAARDARNRSLGKLGEERVLIMERSRLHQVGRQDLAERVRWISEEIGDGAGFDILSFESTGKERFIEVKTTAGGWATPFYLSENERVLSVEKPDSFRLIRLYDVARVPRAFELIPPLENGVLLSPISYRASFG